MVLDSIVVALMVAGAAGYLMRYFAPKPKRAGACGPACAACPAKEQKPAR